LKRRKEIINIAAKIEYIIKTHYDVEGLKDRPQEVKETLLPRKLLFASERHLCPQAMQK
jgi:hypothetical protein